MAEMTREDKIRELEELRARLKTPAAPPQAAPVQAAPVATPQAAPQAPAAPPSTMQQAETTVKEFSKNVLGEAPPRGETLYEDAPLATGVWSSFMDFWNSTAGQIPGAAKPEYTGARTRFELSINRLRDIMQEEGRRGVGELKNLEDKLKISPGMWESPAEIQERLIEIEADLISRLQENKEVLRTDGISAQDRATARRNNVAIQEMLNVIGAPKWKRMQSKGASGLPPSARAERTEEQIQEDIAKAKEEGAPELRAPLYSQGFAAATEAALGFTGGVIGGAGGITVGAPGGPAAAATTGYAGASVGSAVGSALGRGIGNIVMDLENVLRYGDAPKINAANQALSMIDAAATDLAYSTVFASPVRLFSLAYKGIGRLSGAQSPEVIQAIDDAAKHGISFGASEVPTTFTRTSARVLNAIPVLGAPARKAGEAKAIQVSRAYENIMDELSPSVDLGRLGTRIPTQARSAHRARKAIAGLEFEDMRETLAYIDNPDLIPTDKVSKVARDAIIEGKTPRTLVQEETETLSKKTTRKSPAKKKKEPVITDTAEEVATKGKGKKKTSRLVSEKEDFGDVSTTEKQKVVSAEKEGRIRVPGYSESVQTLLEDTANIVPRASFEELYTLQKRLNRAINNGDSLSQGELGLLRKLNGAVWESLSTLSPEDVAKGWERNNPRMKLSGDDATQIYGTIMAKVRSAKRSWADLKALEDSAAAGVLRSVDKNFFSAGFSKMDNAKAELLVNHLVKDEKLVKSPTFVRDLRRLVGRENMRKIARTYLEKVINPQPGLSEVAPGEGGRLLPERVFFPGGKRQAVPGQTDIVAFEAGNARNALGLSGRDPQARNALEEMLQGTGVSSERLDSFLRAAEKLENVPLTDPSTFVQRRLVLTMGGGKQGFGRAVAGAVTGGVAHSGGLISIGGMLITGRTFARLMTSPAGLKILREGMDPNLSRQQMYRLIAQVGRQFPDLRAHQFGDERYEGPRMQDKTLLGRVASFGGPR